MAEITATASTPEEVVSMAGGIGVFEKGKDDKVADVFARADAAMYEDKMKMKKANNTGGEQS